ncbi:MAG: hypothetical protein R3C14_39775 [Caldilineaceae bacterium]
MQQQNDWSRLIQALDLPDEDPLTCTECEAQLPDYVEALAAGHGAAEVWHMVTRHLQGCPHCTAEFTLLSAMLNDLYTASGDEVVAETEPDLAFLQNGSQGSVHKTQSGQQWWRDAIGRLHIALADTLQLMAQPPLQPGLAGNTLKAGSEGQSTLLHLTVPDLGDGRTVQVHVTSRDLAQQPTLAQCTVLVKIDAPDLEPLSRDGIAVTLSVSDVEVDTQWTDALGVVVFAEQPVSRLSQLVIQIMPTMSSAGL